MGSKKKAKKKVVKKKAAAKAKPKAAKKVKPKKSKISTKAIPLAESRETTLPANLEATASGKQLSQAVDDLDDGGLETHSFDNDFEDAHDSFDSDDEDAEDLI